MKDNSDFISSNSSLPDRLSNFAKIIPRQKIARFLCLYEIYKLQLNCKGSIVECGVHQGGSLFSFAKFGSILDPYNYHKKIYGFDTFSGFPNIEKVDCHTSSKEIGMFSENFDIVEDINDCIKQFDLDRPISNIPKVHLEIGDAIETIPKFIERNPHLIISLLYLDFDLFKPTKIALSYFLPRMPKGSVIAFDQLNNPNWPGESLAVFESLELKKHELKSFPWEPNISYLII